MVRLPSRILSTDPRSDFQKNSADSDSKPVVDAGGGRGLEKVRRMNVTQPGTARAQNLDQLAEDTGRGLREAQDRTVLGDPQDPQGDCGVRATIRGLLSKVEN